MSNIEWTDETWNPVIGCTPVSAGCLNCYAATMARRLEAMGREEYDRRLVDRKTGQPASEGIPGLYEGKYRILRIAEVKGGRAFVTGDVRTQPDRLTEPLHWRKPRRIFVCSMSDLFHEDVPFEFVDRVWAVMALCPQHTFQILTKRPERMAEYLAAGRGRWGRFGKIEQACLDWHDKATATQWPLPNVWLGTSVEDQKAADERIPHLLGCPAALRFLSCEPLLGPVDLIRFLDPDPLRIGVRNAFAQVPEWVIVGGESGPKARPCDVEWIRGIIGHCREAGVPVFVKQLGAKPVYQTMKHYGGRTEVLHSNGAALTDRKGGDPAEWPGDLRVREWPRAGGGA